MLNKKAILIASMIIYSKGYAIEVKFSCIAFSLTPYTQTRTTIVEPEGRSFYKLILCT